MSILDQKTFIRSIAPFDKLTSSELAQVLNATDIEYFTQNTLLITPDSEPAYLYIIVKGVVEEKGGDGLVSLHTAQDKFDVAALLEGKSKHHFTVKEELICYLLPKALFLELIRKNDEFEAFYYQNLSQRLNHLVSQRKTQELASFMVAKIGEIYLRPAYYVKADQSIYEAVTEMKKHKISSILVKHEEKIGIVSDTDIREYVVLQRYSIDSSVGNIATYDLIGMKVNDFLFNALLLMTKHAIKRLVIYDETGQEIIGILDQLELLSFFSNQSYLISVEIERANTIESLKKASQKLLDMVQMLYAKGVKIRYITRLVNELNKKILHKVYTFIATPELLERSCLIVMGSEGRGEQILRTDQDNAIILKNGFFSTNLDNIAQKFTQTLLDFGYPPCQGKIMVNNPQWCKSLDGFKEDIYHWTMHPTSETMMNLAIFYDATVVVGDENLLHQARTYLFNLLQDNVSFYSHFAKSTLAFETPLGLFTHFIVEKSTHKNELDIKKGGIFAIVQGVRSLALEHKLTATCTLERIKLLQEKGVLQEKFATDLTDAFCFMLSLKLQAGLEKEKLQKPHDNYINPDQLHKLERDLLKDSFKVVNEFKKFITYHFKLNMVS